MSRYIISIEILHQNILIDRRKKYTKSTSAPQLGTFRGRTVFKVNDLLYHLVICRDREREREREKERERERERES